MSVSDAAQPDSVRKAQFAIVPMWAHRKVIATRTRTMALAVYVELIGQYAGSTRDAEGLRVWPEIQQIADSMGVPKSSVERALKVLIDCGVVLKKRTMRRNQYWLPQEDPDQFAQTLADFQSVTSDGLDSVQSVASDGPGTVTSDGLQTVTSDGLYNPDPSIQTQETQTLSPLVPAQRVEPEPATSERENLSPSKDPQQTNPLPGVDVYTAQLANADAVTRVTTSWTEAYKRSSSGSEPSARAVSRVRASATSRLRAGKTADDLVLIAADMAETNLAWTDLAEHEAHWLHKQHGGLTGTDADKPSVTDQRVQQALDLGRQMQAEANARHSSGYDDARTYMNQQAAIGARPYGWEQVPHCGHLDCDEITRYRQTEDADGLRSLSACPDCHPSLRF